MNKNAAKEWLIKSWHNLSSTKILLNANHYTDVIAVDLHYSLEKTLKAFSAYENKKFQERIIYWNCIQIASSISN